MNIYEAITSIMAEVPAIGKDKKNQKQGFLYRGIDDVMNVLQPILAKYKVFCVPEVLEQKREERVSSSGNTLLYSVMKVKYTFFAEDGSSVSAVVIGEGMDSGDKASNKALAIAMKYVFFQVFCIPTEEMKDPDGETPEPSTPKTKQYPPAIPQQDTEPPCLCNRCHNEILAKKHSGKLYTVADIIRNSQKTFGANLCWACMKELNAENAWKSERPEAIMCEECGNQITDSKNQAGEPWKAKDISVYTKLRYNKKLCANCLEKAKEAEKAGMTNENAS